MMMADHALDKIRTLLEKGELVTHSMFVNCQVDKDMRAALQESGLHPREDGVEAVAGVRVFGPYLGAVFEASTAIEEAVARADDVLRESVAAVKDLAVEQAKRATKDAHFDNEESRQLFCNSVGDDFQLISEAVACKHSTPFVNAIWVSYRSGNVPYAPLQVEGELTDLIHLDHNTAKRTLGYAMAEYHKAIEQKKPAVSFKVKSGRIPIADVRRLVRGCPNLLKANDPGTVVIDSLVDLETGTKVPQAWRELLGDQDRRVRPKWDRVWAGQESVFPSVYRFLKRHCKSVALVLRPESPPGLLYCYGWEGAHNEQGLDAYIGLPPLGERVKKDVEEKLAVMPPELRHFYCSVHNGWCQVVGRVYGPLEIDFVSPLSKDIGNLIVKQEKRNVDLRRLFEVMRLRGGGDALCLDIERKDPSTSGALWVGDPAKLRTGLDLWKEMNKWIDFAREDMLEA